jgi:hypothetical protein
MQGLTRTQLLELQQERLYLELHDIYTLKGLKWCTTILTTSSQVIICKAYTNYGFPRQLQIPV